MENYIWEVTFNLPPCLDKQKDFVKTNASVNTSSNNKSFTDESIIYEEDITIQYLNKWKELMEKEE